MTITRFDPADELRPLPAGSGESTPTDAHPSPSGRPLVYDVYRIGRELCIDFEVPGIDPATMHLGLEDRILVVSVTRELETDGADVIERGRAHGTFEQRLLLPRQWGIDQLRARCVNGVLEVRAPLVRPSATRSIAIAGAAAAVKVAARELPTPDAGEVSGAAREQVGSAA